MRSGFAISRGSAALLLVALSLTFASAAAAQSDGDAANGSGVEASAGPVAERGAWDAEIVARFGALPIQDGGRVKPISTYAYFQLLKTAGRRYAHDLDGERLSPTEWLLDTLFHPESARRYRVFLVQDSALLDAIGVSHVDRKRRDRYSFEELAPGYSRLHELAVQANELPKGRRTPLQNQMINLVVNLIEYDALLHQFDFARADFGIAEDSALARLFPDTTLIGLASRAHLLRVAAAVLNRGMEALEERLAPEDLERIRQLLPPEALALDDAAREREMAAVEALLGRIDQASQSASHLAVLPPHDPEASAWRTPGEVLISAFLEDASIEPYQDMLAAWERLGLSADDPVAFAAALEEMHAAVTPVAKARGEYRTVPIEVAFYRADFFSRSLALFIFAFILVAITWLFPRWKWAYVLSGAALLPPLALLITGIVYRCIIRGRPPVTTLYETILFITASVVIVSLIIEVMNRRRLALSVGALLGIMGMFLAVKYEALEGVDTMPSLIAVLDTNFWLTTHVLTVTLGYAAGLLAAAFSHVYLVGRIVRADGGGMPFRQALTRMTYGVIAFGLVFSVVGTVLGGIWAADSWGRFWGWDPKENGALMIILWELAILHARKDGLIRELGLHIASVFNAVVVGFSWWGVNLLGVGLHSYGHTSGVSRGLTAFCLAEAAMIALGLYLWARAPRAADSSRP